MSRPAANHSFPAVASLIVAVPVIMYNLRALNWYGGALLHVCIAE
jgi:hypothetical protein